MSMKVPGGFVGTLMAQSEGHVQKDAGQTLPPKQDSVRTHDSEGVRFQKMGEVGEQLAEIRIPRSRSNAFIKKRGSVLTEALTQAQELVEEKIRKSGRAVSLTNGGGGTVDADKGGDRQLPSILDSKANALKSSKDKLADQASELRSLLSDTTEKLDHAEKKLSIIIADFEQNEIKPLGRGKNFDEVIESFNAEIKQKQSSLESSERKLSKANVFTKGTYAKRQSVLKRELQQLAENTHNLKQKYRQAGGVEAKSEVDALKVLIGNLQADYEKTVKDLAASFDVREIRAPQALKGKLGVRTTIPSELTGGIVEPKDQMEVGAMRTELRTNLDRVREALIAQIPETPLHLGSGIGNPGRFFANNNYVFTLAQHPDITYDDQAKTLTVGTEAPVSVPHGLHGGQAILGEGRMCDDGLSSPKTMEGKFAIHSFNDGNGWGAESQRAAQEANKKAVEVLESELERLSKQDTVTPRDIIRAQDKALFEAHQHISLMDADAATPTGTTCPQLMTVAGDVAHLTSIGDVKAFIVSSDLSSVREPTRGNRGGFNATDPGGRIGQGNVDARNLFHSVAALHPGDIVVLCSDGIHDNLDPSMLGLSPQEVDDKLVGDKWNDDDPAHVEARNKFVGQKMQQILQEYKQAKGLQKLSQQDVNDALNGFVQTSSLKRKLYLMQFPNKREPESKKDYPGKLDHAGLIVYQHPG